MRLASKLKLLESTLMTLSSSVPTAAVSSRSFLIWKNFFAFESFTVSFRSPENVKDLEDWGKKDAIMETEFGLVWFGSHILTIFFFCSSDGGGGTYEAASIIACSVLYRTKHAMSKDVRKHFQQSRLVLLPVVLKVHRRCCLCMIKHIIRKQRVFLKTEARKIRLLSYWLLRSGFGWRYHKLTVLVDPTLLLLTKQEKLKHTTHSKNTTNRSNSPTKSCTREKRGTETNRLYDFLSDSVT